MFALLMTNGTLYPPITDLVTSMLAESGFARMDRKTSRGVHAYSSAQRPAKLEINFVATSQVFDPPGGLGAFDSISAGPRQNYESSRLNSGIRFGAGVSGHRWSKSDAGEAIRVSGFHTSLNVALRYLVERTNGSPRITGAAENDSEFLEGIVRWTFAQSEAQFCSSSSYSWRGKTYPALRDDLNCDHISSSAFAANERFSLYRNNEEGRAFIENGNKDVILALGAPEVKIGSEWVPIKTVVMARGDDILIPTEILSRL